MAKREHRYKRRDGERLRFVVPCQDVTHEIVVTLIRGRHGKKIVKIEAPEEVSVERLPAVPIANPP